MCPVSTTQLLRSFSTGVRYASADDERESFLAGSRLYVVRIHQRHASPVHGTQAHQRRDEDPRRPPVVHVAALHKLEARRGLARLDERVLLDSRAGRVAREEGRARERRLHGARRAVHTWVIRCVELCALVGGGSVEGLALGRGETTRRGKGPGDAPSSCSAGGRARPTSPTRRSSPLGRAGRSRSRTARPVRASTPRH